MPPGPAKRGAFTEIFNDIDDMISPSTAVVNPAVVNPAVAVSAVVNPAVAVSAHCQYMRLFKHLYKQSLNTNEFRFLLLMLSKGALNRVGVEASNIDIAAETGIDISKVPSLTCGMVDKKIVLKKQNTATKKNIYFITENFFPAF
jgi:hypothetical protein